MRTHTTILALAIILSIPSMTEGRITLTVQPHEVPAYPEEANATCGVDPTGNAWQTPPSVSDPTGTESTPSSIPVPVGCQPGWVSNDNGSPGDRTTALQDTTVSLDSNLIYATGTMQGAEVTIARNATTGVLQWAQSYRVPSTTEAECDCSGEFVKATPDGTRVIVTGERSGGPLTLIGYEAETGREAWNVTDYLPESAPQGMVLPHAVTTSIRSLFVPERHLLGFPPGSGCRSPVEDVQSSNRRVVSRRLPTPRFDFTGSVVDAIHHSRVPRVPLELRPLEERPTDPRIINRDGAGKKKVQGFGAPRKLGITSPFRHRDDVFHQRRHVARLWTLPAPSDSSHPQSRPGIHQSFRDRRHAPWGAAFQSSPPTDAIDVLLAQPPVRPSFPQEVSSRLLREGKDLLATPVSVLLPAMPG
jgi:hypothetical protein